MYSSLLNIASRARSKLRDDQEAEFKGLIPTGKKFYNSSMFHNSKEFTQLGTLAKENRIAEYYQPDIPPQPKAAIDVSDFAFLNPVQ